MLIYHDSDCIVEKPEIRTSTRALDFGVSFYCATNYQQAADFAPKVYKRNKCKGKQIVNIYEFDYENLPSGIKVSKFEKPNKEWFDLVLANRLKKHIVNKYDIIYGPVANDRVYDTFIAYEDELLTYEQALANLEIVELYNQFVFCNKCSLALIKFVCGKEV
jgi:hypothetical protein